MTSTAVYNLGNLSELQPEDVADQIYAAFREASIVTVEYFGRCFTYSPATFDWNDAVYQLRTRANRDTFGHEDVEGAEPAMA